MKHFLRVFNLVGAAFFTVSLIGWCARVGYFEAVAIVTQAALLAYCIRNYLALAKEAP